MLFSMVATFAEWGTVTFPGTVVGIGLTAFFPQRGLLEHPRFVYFVSVPLNALIYTMIVVLLFGLARIAKRAS